MWETRSSTLTVDPDGPLSTGIFNVLSDPFSLDVISTEEMDEVRL
jgi:hypothetical protein